MPYLREGTQDYPQGHYEKAPEMGCEAQDDDPLRRLGKAGRMMLAELDRYLYPADHI